LYIVLLTADELDSFMYQTVGHDAIHLQAECLSIPLYREYITGQSVDQSLNYTHPTATDETEDLFRLLSHVKSIHPEVQGVSVGAILSNYQRARVENVCGRLGLTCLAYLWQRNQKELLAEMINAGLTAVVIKVAAIGMFLPVHLYQG
jgi:diphthine-ammonia ligase